MNKVCKYHMILTIFISVFLIFVLRKLTVLEDKITQNHKKAEVLEQLENYDSDNVKMIIVQGANCLYDDCCFITEKEDAEYFAKFMEMFWGENSSYTEEKLTRISLTWTVTFVNSLGEVLTFYIYPDNVIGVKGDPDGEGVCFTLESWDDTVAKEMFEEAYEQRRLESE